MRKGKKILLTGVSSGIGKAILHKLLENHFEVVGISRRKVKKQDGFFPYSIDLSKRKEMLLKIKEIRKEHPDIEGIICNAGIGLFGSLEEFSESMIDTLFEINFFSSFFLIKEWIPTFKKRKRGDIIFIGSEAGLKGQKLGSLYCSSKFALRGFSQALKEECSKQNIRITSIFPGMTHTSFYDDLSFFPSKEEGCGLEAEDIADFVLFLLLSKSHVNFDEVQVSPIRKKIERK